MQSDKNLVLVLPSMKHRAAAKEYISEFIDAHDDIDGMGIDPDVISDYDAYGNWLYWLYGEKSTNSSNKIAGIEDRSFTYFYIDEADDKLIGTVSIRKENEIEKKYGNLGFAVRPSMRGQGYGSEMVETALCLCGFFGMQEVTAVCLSNNKAAIGLLTRCGFNIVSETEEGFLKYVRKV